MAETLDSFGHPKPSLLDVRKTVGLTLEDSMRRLTNNQCDEASIPKMVKMYRGLHNQRAAAMTSLFDGTLDTLMHLRFLGITTILVSNKGRQGLHQLTEHLMIKEHLDQILSAEDVVFRKPDARLFSDNIIPLLKDGDRSSVLVVGDTESDILFAQNANLASCWASYGYGDAEKCRLLEPTFQIGTIKELGELIQA